MLGFNNFHLGFQKGRLSADTLKILLLPIVSVSIPPKNKHYQTCMKIITNYESRVCLHVLDFCPYLRTIQNCLRVIRYAFLEYLRTLPKYVLDCVGSLKPSSVLPVHCAHDTEKILHVCAVCAYMMCASTARSRLHAWCVHYFVHHMLLSNVL